MPNGLGTDIFLLLFETSSHYLGLELMTLLQLPLKSHGFVYAPPYHPMGARD